VASAAFSFINGFHDTANAVATVIYTNTLRPIHAVVWSGIWNFLGTWAGGIAVAMSIVAIFPVHEVMLQNNTVIFSIFFAVLITAISWNLFTWYLGIPCTSSHTLMGSLVGAGIGFSLSVSHGGINWKLVLDMALALIISPAFGFSAAILLLSVFRAFVRNNQIFEPPKGKEPPPLWIRFILITTCTGVSFFHGSNDGQKGVGLVMIILLTLLPAHFALNTGYDNTIALRELDNVTQLLEKNHHTVEINALIFSANKLKEDIQKLNESDKEEIIAVRRNIQKLNKTIRTVIKDPEMINNANDRRAIQSSLKKISHYTDYAPRWVIMLIALSIGIGTMIGWKRIVVTIGEKIGRTHLTYAQGAAAETIAASTIGLSTGLGLPVSTTHVLSSGVAGSMVASNGVQNLQKSTITSIAITWVLTLPVTIIVSGGIFMILHWIF
jgi:PiT family inorganic phosphate transporter